MIAKMNYCVLHFGVLPIAIFLFIEGNLLTAAEPSVLFLSTKESLHKVYLVRYDFARQQVEYERLLGTNVLYRRQGDKFYVSYRPVLAPGEESDMPGISNKVEVIDIETGKSDVTIPCYIKPPRWYWNDGLKPAPYLNVNSGGTCAFLQGSLTLDQSQPTDAWCVFEIDLKIGGLRYYRTPANSLANQRGIGGSITGTNGIAFLERKDNLEYFSFDKKTYTTLPFNYIDVRLGRRDYRHKQYIPRVGVVALDSRDNSLVHLTNEDFALVHEAKRVLTANIADQIEGLWFLSEVRRCVYSLPYEKGTEHIEFVMMNWENGRVLCRWKMDGYAYRAWFSGDGTHGYFLDHTLSTCTVYAFVETKEGESMEPIKLHVIDAKEIMGTTTFTKYSVIIPLS